MAKKTAAVLLYEASKPRAKSTSKAKEAKPHEATSRVKSMKSAAETKVHKKPATKVMKSILKKPAAKGKAKAAKPKTQELGDELRVDTGATASRQQAQQFAKFEYIDACEYRYGVCRNFMAVSGGIDSFWLASHCFNEEFNRVLAAGLECGRVPVYRLTARLTMPEDSDHHIGTVTEWGVSRYISMRVFKRTAALTGWEAAAVQQQS